MERPLLEAGRRLRVASKVWGCGRGQLDSSSAAPPFLLQQVSKPCNMQLKVGLAVLVTTWRSVRAVHRNKGETSVKSEHTRILTGPESWPLGASLLFLVPRGGELGLETRS